MNKYISYHYYLLEICTRQQLESLLQQQGSPKISLAGWGVSQWTLAAASAHSCQDRAYPAVPVWISTLVKFINESTWKKKSTLCTPSILVFWRTFLFNLCYWSWSPVRDLIIILELITSCLLNPETALCKSGAIILSGNVMNRKMCLNYLNRVWTKIYHLPSPKTNV